MRDEGRSTGEMPVVRIEEGVGDGIGGVFAGEIGFGEGMCPGLSGAGAVSLSR
jgi:hypothetical protein